MISLFSPAKINLFFKMIGLRKDGFHNLESFFQAINLGDELTFSLSSKDEFISNDATLRFDNDNFIYQALQLFRNKTNNFSPVRIVLDKKIPKEAGLGGGSSNVATTLWGLNQLCNSAIDIAQLQEWSKEISSDAPFFFSNGSAICEGRGEIISDVKTPNVNSNIWIVKPPYSLSTKEVYLYSKKESKISDSLQILLDKVYSRKPVLENDLEEAAFMICPRLALLKDELEYQGFKQVFMTGSGSAYVCIGNHKPKFENPVQIFPIQYISRTHTKWYQGTHNAIT
ncbi:MAG: 4-diphosphocytidyl-2-C-methyl-D-erythritol kinase [Chlamydiae bacterium]|nr:4-diphosphocytidyl-2-C-methyl-D-erythritol kinase [Chlamydiota bacterium]